jgi:prevent-host-death family protein
MKPRTVSATDFKARCLALLDDVHENGGELVITKRGEAVARLVPVASQRRSLSGAWKGLVRLNGDIVHVDRTDDFEASR